MNPSQQNTPLDPRKQDTPLDNNSQKTPLQPGAGQEPVSTPIKGSPLESQGLAAGQIPAMPGQEMATPEQRQQLVDLLDATKASMSELQTTKFRSANEEDAMRIETLKEIFQAMQAQGVDLNDPASVSSFLDKLDSTNPTMSQYFKEALDNLMGDQAPIEEQQMGMQPDSFDDAGPMGAPAEPMAPPMPATPAPESAMPPGMNMTPPSNEALPQDTRGPLPPQGGA